MSRENEEFCGLKELMVVSEEINGMNPKSDQGTLKAYKEIEWPALYFKTFTCFSRLPPELRRKIWFHALPEPRLVNFELYTRPEALLDEGQHPDIISIVIRDYTATTNDAKNEEMSLDTRPFFLTCHEFKDAFLEHYKSFDIRTQIPADGRYLYTPPTIPTYSSLCHARMGTPPSQCYIDPKVDRLKFDNLVESLEILSSIGIILNLSALQHIAIAQYSKSANGSDILETTLKAIEDNFPQLKSVTLSGGFAGTHVDRSLRSIPTITRFHPLSGDTIRELCRQTICQNPQGLITPLAWILNTLYKNDIFTAAEKTKKIFFERTSTNGKYWKGVDFTISLAMEHILHLAKDYIQLKSRRPIGGNQGKIYYTQAVGKFDIGSAYLKRAGGSTVKNCYARGALFNSGPDREDHKFHETHQGDGTKYLTWPWHRPSLGENDSYDGSRFKDQVFGFQ
ncbi:hypothetical protein EAE96_008303 [Botrytis aclada]|nr:hypothetical protein EAE96_008303 [Botrytis aclada]